MTAARHARSVAAHAVFRIMEDGGYSQHVLAAALAASGLDARDRGAVSATVYGTIADLRAIDLALDRVVDRGRASLPPLVLSHLRCGVWALARGGARGSEAAPVLNAVVHAARADGLDRHTGLINATLRAVLRDSAVVFAPPTKASELDRLGLELGLPNWIAESLRDARGAAGARAAMAAFDAPTPVAVRVRRGGVEEAADALRADGVVAVRHPLVPGALVCSGGYVAGTRAHDARVVAIQDAGAQLAVLAMPRTARPVWDVCAGIGGKTRHLLDRFDTVVATDPRAAKLGVLRREAPDVGPRLITAAIRAQGPLPSAVRTHAPFAGVLVDAPCSALGTLGRHPEVRWNRTPAVVSGSAALQHEILGRAAEHVAPGGVLVYVVCTWTPEETVDQVRRLVADYPELTVDPPSAETAAPEVDWPALVDARGFVTLWPDTTSTDGFFIARLRRTA